jgi:hypothetical protein
VAIAVLMALVAMRKDQPDRLWRLMPAAAVVAAPVLLGGMVLTACLWRVEIDQLPAGPLVMMYPAYGWAVGAGIVAVAGCLAIRLTTASAGESVTAPEPALPTSAGRLRARLAPTLAHGDVVVITFAVAFVAAAITALIVNRNSLDAYRLTDTPPVTVATWSFFLLLGFLFVNFVRSRADRASLRRVGTIWDILTFWPRSFHPFAVRSYAERAVPELQELLRTNTSASDMPSFVIAAHSQGSILAYAALRPYVDTWPVTSTVPGYVTFGSPLRTLYLRAFPHYFSATEFAATRTALNDRWTNLFRFTDYVGRAVFANDEDVARASAPDDDRWLADPGAEGEPVQAHSGYWDDRRVRSQVAEYDGGTP